MNPEQTMRAALDRAFAELGDVATGEALSERVGQTLRRRIPARMLEQLMRKYPTEYTMDDAGRWSRVTRIEADTRVDDAVARPTPALTLQPGRYVVFDLETTGTWRGSQDDATIEIIQIAAQRYHEYLPDGAPFVTFVRSDGEIPATITHITRITRDDVADAPHPLQALADFLAYVGDAPLIAHNGALFDGPVLAAVAKRIGLTLPGALIVLDTLPLARVLLPLDADETGAGLPNHRLETLAGYYGCAEEGAHRADVDVAMLGGVVRGLLGELGAPTGTPLHQIAGFVRALLQKADDPWVRLLPPSLMSADLSLASLFSLFGANATPTLTSPLAPNADHAAPSDTDIEMMLERYVAQGSERRKAQAQLAHLAGNALREGTFAVVEAATGTGKGLGYLAAAYVKAKATGQPVVISTFTRVLQAQLFTDDLSLLSNAVAGDVRYALLKGRRNYLSSRCLAEEIADAWDEPRLDAGRAWALATLAAFAIYTPDGDLNALSATFAALAHVTKAHDHAFMQVGAVSELRHDNSAEVWNTLEQVRVTAETPFGAWPEGLLRPQDRIDFMARARLNARNADIVVVNHSLLLLKALKGEDDERDENAGLLSPYVICDEAHTLEDAATSVLTHSIEVAQMDRIVAAINGRRGLARLCTRLGLADDDPTLAALHTYALALDAHSTALGKELQRFIDRRVTISAEDRARYGMQAEITRHALHEAGGPALKQVSDQWVEALVGLKRSLHDLAAPIERQSQLDGRNGARAERIRLAVLNAMGDLVPDAIWFWRFADANATVRVISIDAGVDDRAWSISGMPIAVNAQLHDGLWSRVSAGVLVSATLTTRGDDFTFFTERIGLSRLPQERLVCAALDPVFDYHNHALFMMPNHLPTPRDTALRKAYPQAVAAELRRFIPFFGGKTLGLFTARSRMEQVREQIVGDLERADLPLLTQGEANVVKRFQDEERTSLLGVRSLWEGVNVPGTSLSYVVIEKFPFPSLGNPLEKARMAAVERVGGEGFYNYLLPRAIFQFKQGFGRLIRSSTDHGAVIMLDKRLRGALYRADVLAALPDPTIGYESDQAMYARLAEWMGLDFDPTTLPAPPPNHALSMLAENRLPRAIVTDDEWGDHRAATH